LLHLFFYAFYLYAVFAKNNGQNDIPVYIFPFRMTNDNLENSKKQHENKSELLDFWENLKKGYDKFMLEKKALNVKVDKDGNYEYFLP